MVPPHFYPERQKDGKVRFSKEITYIPNKERACLTKDQAHTNL